MYLLLELKYQNAEAQLYQTDGKYRVFLRIVY